MQCDVYFDKLRGHALWKETSSSGGTQLGLWKAVDCGALALSGILCVGVPSLVTKASIGVTLPPEDIPAITTAKL